MNAGNRIAFGRIRFVLRDKGQLSQSVFDRILSLAQYEVEKLTGQLFAKLGFETTVTRQTGDGGST